MSTSIPGRPIRARIVHKLRQVWVVLPMLLVMIALMWSDIGEQGRMPWNSDPCGLKDLDQTDLSARMYLPLAGWALHHTASPDVALLLIDSDTRPAGLLNNACESRVFLAKLIQDLNALSVRAIVIDQYFSADYCPEQQRNAKFVQAMQDSTVPVVVGQATHPLTAASASGGCLALTNHLDFGRRANVSYGLTRLNRDAFKIPLRWPVFAESPQVSDEQTAAASTQAPKPLPAHDGDTLSLVAARLADPHLDTDPKIARLLTKGTHPYTTFLDLPQINAMTVMCSSEKSPTDIFGNALGETCTHWTRPLENLDGKRLSLSGKVAVIGLVSPLDMKSFPTGEKPGVFLQANYVQSILDRRFLIEIPAAITMGFLIVFVCGVYLLYWAHDREGRALLTLHQAGLVSIAVLVLTCLFSLIVLLTINYFTPIWALWAAGSFVVYRYLEEVGYSHGERLFGKLTEHPSESTEPDFRTADHHNSG